MVEITVNGEQQKFERELTISQFLERQALSGKRLAVERNGEIVPKSAHQAVYFEDGDKLEIVVAVGGG